ncbi:hypothetical protein AVEN_154068-1 [Araneus ventricosus]|uniref:Uncharacterized protein n=1 Tax=Araneus ventricosus TaxID=182803 RepID=A0A4Y2IY54_ARAVE|nr:hypothetical protein AVEN_154068-1 [Araneus ventricosus]
MAVARQLRGEAGSVAGVQVNLKVTGAFGNVTQSYHKSGNPKYKVGPGVVRHSPSLLRGYRPSSEMGPASHTTIIVPTSRSENPLTYPATSNLRTRGASWWESFVWLG